MTELNNLIASHWQAPELKLEKSRRNASTAEILGPQWESSEQQIHSAIECAEQTHRQQRWTQMPAEERAQCMDRIALRLDEQQLLIAEADARETGVTISTTKKIAFICGASFRAGAELIRNPPAIKQYASAQGEIIIERLPLGPAAIIAPWNAPSGIACHKLASAMAAGCPSLLKPSEWAPTSAQLIAEAMLNADIPVGMFQLLHGGPRTGGRIVKDSRMSAVSFTGGLPSGRAVAQACAHDIKPVQLELGGNNPVIILAEADINQAADGVVTALTTLNGQWCRALGRLLVHKSCEKALLNEVGLRLANLKIDDALNPQTQMGPLIHQDHRDLVQTQITELQSCAGTVHQWSSLPSLDGWFLPPTLITGVEPNKSLHEIFGPVAAVHTFETDEEVVALANQSPFGLAAYVFGDPSHALSIAKRITTGGIKINAVGLLSLNPLTPRPAWGLSGIGDEGTIESFEFFRGTRVISIYPS